MPRPRTSTRIRYESLKQAAAQAERIEFERNWAALHKVTLDWMSHEQITTPPMDREAHAPIGNEPKPSHQVCE